MKEIRDALAVKANGEFIREAVSETAKNLDDDILREIVRVATKALAERGESGEDGRGGGIRRWFRRR